jgi:hypothetical protein
MHPCLCFLYLVTEPLPWNLTFRVLVELGTCSLYSVALVLSGADLTGSVQPPGLSVQVPLMRWSAA